MKELKKILIDFCAINTGTMFGTLAYTYFFIQDNYIRKSILLEIAVVAFGASIANTYANKIEFKGRLGAFLCKIINCVAINVVIVGEAILFGWIDKGEVRETIELIGVIVFVYIIVSTCLYSRDKKIADEINNEIKKYNKE